jgi:predicted dehydrogenase
VLLDAIHEVDLLLWLAGDDDRFDVLSALLDRIGPLEIDVEDTVRALLRHADGWIAEIALDYLSRRYRRGVEVIGSRATARLDWARQTLELETADGVQTWAADAAVALSYVAEAERFLSFVQDGASPPVDGTRGLRSLVLAERIRAMAR